MSQSPSIHHAVIPARHVVVDVSGGDQVCPGTMVAIYVGGTGNIALEDHAGTQETYSAVPVGFHSMKMKKVLQTGTTATNMKILFA